MNQCCDGDDEGSVYTLILRRAMEHVQFFYTSFTEIMYIHYLWVVGDLLGFDAKLLLQYINLIYWPVIIFLVLPIMLLVLLYASALFLTVYRWRSRLHEAYHKDFWDGARQTLAVLWEGQASLWHGYDVEGLENIPEEGPALLIYYHGALPIDMYYLIAKIYLYKQRLIHPIGDRCLFYVPGFQRLMRVFQVHSGTVESCTKLLQDGQVISIAPGGIREALFSHDYQLLWNKRLGFAKVALASKAPIIPIFTRNVRQAVNTVSHGAGFFRFLYEKTRLPLAIYYGVFPVKLTTYIGKPLFTENTKLTPEQLYLQVHEAVDKMVKQHQGSNSILLAIIERFFSR